MKKLLCGASETVITPKPGLEIPGYFGARIATGTLTDLYTVAVALDNGEKSVILISIDIVDFQAPLAKKVRAKIQAATGVEPSSVLVHATHTHTAQPTNYTGFGVKKNTRAVNRLIDLVADNAIKAYENRRPVRMGFGTGNETRIAFTRNYRMKDGGIMTNPIKGHAQDIVEPLHAPDTSVGVLRFDDAEGKTVAEIINFACHPDTIGGTNYSADYPGVCREVTKKALGEGSVVLFLNGCAADINHIDAIFFRDNPDTPYCREFYRDHYIKMGTLLAETVGKIHADIQLTDDAEIDFTSKTYRAKRRQPTEEMIAEAEAILANDPNIHDRIYAEERLSLKTHPLIYATIEIQALRIGNCSVVGLPCEAYNDMGDDIKSTSPFENNMVVSLANGLVGYVVTEPAFSAGVYESKLSRYNSSLSPCDAEKMVKVAGKLQKKLYS